MNSLRPNAPTDCITYSHERGEWLASWQGQWVGITHIEARQLFDKGWTLLDS